MRIEHEPYAEYHEQGKHFLRSHALIDFRKCPLLFRKKQLGLIPDEDKASYAVGRSAHKYILEGEEAFNREYVVGGPVNPKTGKSFRIDTQKYAEWAALQSGTPIPESSFELIVNMKTAIQCHNRAAELISSGEAESVFRVELGGLPVQYRADWINKTTLVDLKTCRDLDRFECDAKDFGYLWRMAFGHAVLEIETGVEYDVEIIAVEKQEPYRVGVWKVHHDKLRLEKSENMVAIEQLKRCRESDTWPTLYEEPRIFC